MLTLYIDPGTGSMLISALIAFISVAFFMLRGFFHKLFNFSGEKGDLVDLDKEYGLVFYSEGKQYWNVFYPVLEECSKRGIKASYMTSDKDDPALQADIEGIEFIYIGSGQESFYFLNRLHADMVVMTTPGLDVLEIKRSKHVKHYCHLTHAMGSVAGYKAYALDYFDSVLLGGDLDIKVIRELEELRGLPEKEIAVVGHTYVDALRETLQKENFEYTYFKERKPTILLSPTWGNHGLLMNYGEELLSALEKDNKYNVIVRAHPQSFISEQEMIEPLMEKFPNNESRVWDRERENLKALSHADIMISDFSGITFDFFTLFKKPILTMNAHYEKRGRDIIDIEAEPWDIQALDAIGKTIKDKDIPHIIEIIDDTLENFDPDSLESQKVMNQLDKYPNESRERTVDFIEKRYNSILVDQKEDVSDEDINEEASLYAKKGQSFKETLQQLFSPTALIQYTMGLGLLALMIYVTSWLIPSQGLNQEFLAKLLPLTLKSLIFSGLIFLLVSFYKNKQQFTYIKKFEKAEAGDLLLILLSLTPISQYVFANQDMLNFKDSLLIFTFFTFISLLLVFVLPVLLSNLMSKNITTAVSLSFLFIIVNMADFGRTTRPLYIGLILISLMILTFMLIYFNKKTILYLLVGVFFISTSVSAFANHKSANEIEKQDENVTHVSSEERINRILGDKEPKQTPNVYILIYDAYPNEETMAYYNYDNSYQYDYLLEEGFAIYDGTYSVGAASINSMAHVFNFERMYSNEEMRAALAGEAFSFKAAQNIGYQTQFLGSSDYMTKDHTPTHDFYFPNAKYSIDTYRIIIDAILEGEFRFDVDFSSINYNDYIKAKESILSSKPKQPVLYHSHDDKPGHSQNSGVLLPNETELFIERLEIANEEMKQNIELIRAHDQEAIIVIAGDHGPYLTKNGIGLHDYDINDIDRLDIQDRYGTFLAISWPQDKYIDHYEIKILQDVMPAIFAYIYQDDQIFDDLKLPREIIDPSVIGGVNLKDGKLYGGRFNGEDLFDDVRIRFPK